MNHKSLKTYKPALTADQENVITEALRLQLFVTRRYEKIETDMIARIAYDQKVEMILRVGRELQLDLDLPAPENK